MTIDLRTFLADLPVIIVGFFFGWKAGELGWKGCEWVWRKLQ